jgi:hypothetical protein
MNKLVKIYKELPMNKQGINEKTQLCIEVKEHKVPKIAPN